MLLEESSSSVGRGSPGQSDVTHLSVHRSLPLGFGRNMSVRGDGGEMARLQSVQSDPTLFPSPSEPCVDSDGQQSDGGLHQSPGRSALGAPP